jgi:hypothetical protein
LKGAVDKGDAKRRVASDVFRPDELHGGGHYVVLIEGREPIQNPLGDLQQVPRL